MGRGGAGQSGLGDSLETRAGLQSPVHCPSAHQVLSLPPEPAPCLLALSICRGYACCHSTVKQSYCVGAAGAAAAEESAEQLAANMAKKAAGAHACSRSHRRKARCMRWQSHLDPALQWLCLSLPACLELHVPAEA